MAKEKETLSLPSMPAVAGTTLPVPADPLARLEERILARLDERLDALERRLEVEAEKRDRLDRRVTQNSEEVARVVTRTDRLETKTGRLEVEQRGPIAEAMRSHHDIELGLREQLLHFQTSVTEKLEGQDRLAKAIAEDAERRQKNAEEEQRRESMAAKNLAAKRDYRVRIATVVVPVGLALIAAGATIANAFISAKARDDTVSQTVSQVRAITQAAAAPPPMPTACIPARQENQGVTP